MKNDSSNYNEALDKATALLATGYWLLATASLCPCQPRAYVSNEKSDEITVIDTATDKVVATIKVGQRPRGVVVAPDGKRVYVANGNSNDISVIDPEKNMVIDTIPAGEDPEGITMSPDGSLIYTVNENGGELPSSYRQQRNSLPCRRGYRAGNCRAFSDGAKAYVPNESSHNVTVIDTATHNGIERHRSWKIPWRGFYA
jgi:YVTN family beta-propeller protein